MTITTIITVLVTIHYFILVSLTAVSAAGVKTSHNRTAVKRDNWNARYKHYISLLHADHSHDIRMFHRHDIDDLVMDLLLHTHCTRRTVSSINAWIDGNGKRATALKSQPTRKCSSCQKVDVQIQKNVELKIV